ncbi:hypothetical protein Y1Q_0018954 [Alligator mississippiensis]|uniref:Uncharacterized protein n=1 Tax=Alligator mississippiensis TaxID=8496 RepID=A0A151M3G1_ALLMI|nr:hypothetical protein Y1Q_0018954 [Alligator mississippiensis]
MPLHWVLHTPAKAHQHQDWYVEAQQAIEEATLVSSSTPHTTSEGHNWYQEETTDLIVLWGEAEVLIQVLMQDLQLYTGERYQLASGIRRQLLLQDLMELRLA